MQQDLLIFQVKSQTEERFESVIYVKHSQVANTSKGY